MSETFYERTGRRLFDLAASTLLLLCLLPLFAILALAIKLTSRGPVLYLQERVGRNGRSFRIIKFRSMIVNADRQGPSLTTAGDRRITEIGKILRNTKLDELPQLWNVLKGDMSLVGPRPEVPSYVELYSANQRKVLSIRPGITDPASIRYRNEEAILGCQTDPEQYYREVILPDKLNLNLEYMEQLSFSRDLSVLMRTAGSVLSSSSRLTRVS